MLEKPWEIGFDPIDQPHYQPIKDYTYCPFLGSFNNLNIILSSKKSTTYEYFDEVYKLVLDGISENVSLLVHNVKYGAVNTADPDTPVYYFVEFIL